MNLKNREIVGIINMLNAFGDKILPQKISYAITKNISILTKEYAIYEKEMKKLLDRYDSDIVKDENGNIVYGPNGLPKTSTDTSGLNEDMNDLLDISVDVDVYSINEDVFNYDDRDGRFDSMSPTQILILQSILCEHK